MKRNPMLSILMSVLLCMQCVHMPVTAAAETAVQTVYNLVLFAQFDQSGGYNFMDGRTELVQQLCSGTDTYRSLYGYIREVSYGAMETVCYFPQLDGDTVTPYTMSQPLADYATRQAIASEIIKHVAVPDDLVLDGDGDGVIDNIILILDGSAGTRDHLLWPSAFSLGGGSINGKQIGMVNLHNADSLFDVHSGGNAGVLCHEFLHTLGYPDLYCGDRSGMPVGRWDIMAADSVYVQYPLAYMRASISGWLDTADITEDGTYSLAPVSERSGNRVYLLKTPLSDTEFFAVEYRQAGTFPEDEMDTLIYGSGMVVYRINTAVTGNFYEKDQVYVFRPGETETDAGLGDLTASNYGGVGNADHIGTADPDAGIADGALVYSDGVNSGICIEHIIMQNDALTFDVRFAEIDAASVWQSVPSAAQAFNDLDMAVSDSGTVYLAASDGTRAVLYTVSTGGLEQAAVLSGSGFGSVNEVKLAMAGNTPYLLYHDAEYRAVLCRLHAGAWQTVWKSAALAQYSDIAADGTHVYVAYTEGEYPSYALRVCCYDTESAAVTVCGGVLADNVCSLSAVSTDAGCAVAYRDLADGSLPKLAEYKDGAWTVTAVSSAACSSVSAAASGDAVTVTATGACEGVYRCTNGNVEAIGMPALSGACFAVDSVYFGGTLFTACLTQNAADFAVCGYDGTWKQYGGSLANDLMHAPAVVVGGGMIYAACIQPSGNLSVKYLQHAGSLRGDINCDGSFDRADAALLLQWLCGADTVLADWQTGDFDGNGRLDARDLSMMKQALTE